MGGNTVKQSSGCDTAAVSITHRGMAQDLHKTGPINILSWIWKGLINLPHSQGAIGIVAKDNHPSTLMLTTLIKISTKGKKENMKVVGRKKRFTGKGSYKTGLKAVGLEIS